MTRLAFLFFVALAFAGPAAAQATDYEIKLFRPSKTGDRYRIEATGSQRREATVRAGSSAVREVSESVKYDLTAEAEAILVDDKGNVLAASVKVLALVRVDGLRRDELLPPATRVVERRVGSRQTFEIEGRPVVGPLRDALDAVLQETNDSRAPSDDELMGTKERKKVGERWPVNRAALARLLSGDPELDVEIPPEAVEGEGLLKGIERCGDADCARVEVAARLLAAPRGGKENEDTPEKARIEIGVATLLPLDLSLGPRLESSRLTMTFTRNVKGDDGKIRTAEAVWEQTTERRLSALK